MTLFRPKRFVVGRPLRTQDVEGQALPKWLALPVFCSDPLSSVAYATQATLATLTIGGLAAYGQAKWAAAGVAALLLVVAASYRQTCYAYPTGGGAYTVSMDNLGRTAALTAASALLVDYVLTVAVSVAGGIQALTSLRPGLTSHAVAMALGAVVLLMLVNLRGIKESGKAFAIPTYGFVAGIYVMFAWALVRILAGHHPLASSASYVAHGATHYSGLALGVLGLRAFASGCTALTGVEAISNGVPAFRRPRSRNAANTLGIMALLSVTMFGGITALAGYTKVHYSDPDLQHVFGLKQGYSQPSALSQIAAAVFGGHSVLFWYVQLLTAAVLVLAANTAFNGFPVLTSILARDRFLPRQLHNRGDRLVFSNGIVLLAGFAALLLWGFGANVDTLLHLYIIGVFVSFTLSQFGMVRHWNRALADAPDPAQRRRMRNSQAINAVGATATALVLVIVLLTKFLQGAWIVVVAMPALFVTMGAIRRYYDRVAEQLRPAVRTLPSDPSRNHAIVLLSRLHQPALQALAYARSIRPSTLEAVTVAVEPDDVERLEREWAEYGIDVPLTVLDSPYRDITRPIIDYVRQVHRESPRDVVTVFIPEYVVGHWWQQALHNQSALRLKARLLFVPGVMVTNVPFLLPSAHRGVAPDGVEARDDGGR